MTDTQTKEIPRIFPKGIDTQIVDTEKDLVEIGKGKVWEYTGRTPREIVIETPNIIHRHDYNNPSQSKEFFVHDIIGLLKQHDLYLEVRSSFLKNNKFRNRKLKGVFYNKRE